MDQPRPHLGGAPALGVLGGGALLDRPGQGRQQGAVVWLGLVVTWVAGPTVMASTWELTAWLASSSMEEATLPWEAA